MYVWYGYLGPNSIMVLYLDPLGSGLGITSSHLGGRFAGSEARRNFQALQES